MADLEFNDETFFSPIQTAILAILQKNGPMTRAELVKSINQPRSTIYDNLMRLMSHNLVTKYSLPTGGQGHPPVFFRWIDQLLKGEES